MVWVALSLGRPAARLLLYPICLYYVLFSAKARRASREYLSRVLGQRPGLGDLYRHYFFFASTILDRVFLLSGRSELFDICMHGEEVVKRIDLTIPHPRMCERAFVLAPLAEIAPDLVHPETGVRMTAYLAEIEKGGDRWSTSPTI